MGVNKSSEQVMSANKGKYLRNTTDVERN